MSIYQRIVRQKQNHQKSLALLLDPDKVAIEDLNKWAKKIKNAQADYLFIGGSLLKKDHTNKLIKKLKKHLDIPIISFPGNAQQISKHADGLLFLSLISGRNPDFLIGNHVVAAPLLKQTNLEVIPTGYMLIENGHTTSVEYISNTKPIPRNKKDIALATALAGEMLGLKMIYLEAGSGAKAHVPLEMIQSLAENLHIPLIVGGGIRTKKHMLQILNAGADIVVVGTAFEENNW